LRFESLLLQAFDFDLGLIAAKGLKFAPIANDDLRGAALAEFIGSALDAWAVEAGTAYLWSPSLEESHEVECNMDSSSRIVDDGTGPDSRARFSLLMRVIVNYHLI
jgi:hypothetical protein